MHKLRPLAPVPTVLEGRKNSSYQSELTVLVWEGLSLVSHLKWNISNHLHTWMYAALHFCPFPTASVVSSTPKALFLAKITENTYPWWCGEYPWLEISRNSHTRNAMQMSNSLTNTFWVSCCDIHVDRDTHTHAVAHSVSSVFIRS